MNGRGKRIFMGDAVSDNNMIMEKIADISA
jgi:hypothetical protein